MLVEFAKKAFKIEELGLDIGFAPIFDPCL